MNKEKVFNIKLDEGERNAIKVVAAEQGITMQKLVKTAISQYLMKVLTKYPLKKESE